MHNPNSQLQNPNLGSRSRILEPNLLGNGSHIFISTSINLDRLFLFTVTNCQIKWGTLRRCLANARKRQKRRQAIGSKYIKKWRYQDEMSFLLPFIDSRE